MKKSLVLHAIFLLTGMVFAVSSTPNTVRAESFELSQTIKDIDCTHGTLAYSDDLNHPDCPIFAPTVEHLSPNHGQPLIEGAYDAVHAETLRVLLNGVWYTLGVDDELSVSANRWSLDLRDLSPRLTPGDYPIVVEMNAPDTTLHTTTATLTIPAVFPPTVKPIEWVGGNPIITGTFSARDTTELRVQLNNIWYTLGVDDALSVTGDTWQLDLRSLSESLPQGTYDISVESTTYFGEVLRDTTTDELTILPITLPNILTHPTAGPLAATGSSAWSLIIFGIILTSFGVLYVIIFTQRRKREVP